MGNCLKGLSKVVRELRLKRCHSSCCDITIEGGSGPRSPVEKSPADDIYLDTKKLPDKANAVIV